ncbi:MAG: alpha/beta fold hydrolase [Oligoflexus sp.]
MRLWVTLSSFLLVFALAACQLKMSPLLYSFEQWRNNLHEDQIQIDDFTIAYLHGGQGEAIMLVHGFGANKDTWIRFAGKLTERYNVYAIDLPGFGDSSKLAGASYSIEAQAKRLDKIRERLGIQRMHLVGNSMGSNIATVYAAEHPDKLLSLTFINAGGIPTPIPSDAQKKLEEGQNTLLVESREDFERLMEYTFVKPPYIPGPMLEEFFNKAKENRAWNEAISQEIAATRQLTVNYLSKVSVPLLVIWGENDRITHVSATQVIQNIKPQADIHIIPRSGHAPMIESVEESARTFLNFIDQRTM